MEEAIRNYLSEIGRRGGKKSRRTLDFGRPGGVLPRPADQGLAGK